MRGNELPCPARSGAFWDLRWERRTARKCTTGYMTGLKDPAGKKTCGWAGRWWEMGERENRITCVSNSITDFKRAMPSSTKGYRSILAKSKTRIRTKTRMTWQRNRESMKSLFTRGSFAREILQVTHSRNTDVASQRRKDGETDVHILFLEPEIKAFVINRGGGGVNC